MAARSCIMNMKIGPRSKFIRWIFPSQRVRAPLARLMPASTKHDIRSRFSFAKSQSVFYESLCRPSVRSRRHILLPTNHNCNQQLNTGFELCVLQSLEACPPNESRQLKERAHFYGKHRSFLEAASSEITLERSPTGR